MAAADDLVAWVERAGGAPFTDHPYVATIPAARASWDAERTRLSGPATPRRGTPPPKRGLPSAARTAPATPGWRHAEAQLLAGEPPPPRSPHHRSAAAAAAGQHHCAKRSGPSPTAPASRSIASSPRRRGRAGAVRADRAGAAGAAPGRRRPHQSGDRRGTIHQPEDRQRARSNILRKFGVSTRVPGRRARRTRRHPRQAIAVDHRWPKYFPGSFMGSCPMCRSLPYPDSR